MTMKGGYSISALVYPPSLADFINDRTEMPWLLEIVPKADPVLGKSNCLYSVISGTLKT